MAAIEKTAGSGKTFYTPEVDAQIVALVAEKKTVKEIAALVGHSPASIQYRIGRVLTEKNLDEIKYRGQKPAVVEAAPVAKKSKKS